MEDSSLFAVPCPHRDTLILSRGLLKALALLTAGTDGLAVGGEASTVEEPRNSLWYSMFLPS